MKKILTLSLLIFLLNSKIQAQATANAGQDIEICYLDTIDVFGSGLNPGDTGTYQWKDLANGTVYSNTNNLKFKIVSMASRTFELRVQRKKNKITYTAYDTMFIVVNVLPTFTFAGIPPLCYDDGAINLTQRNIVKAFSGDKTVSTTDVHYYQKKTPSWISGGPVGSNPYIYNYKSFIQNGQVPKTGMRDTICYDYRDYKSCYNRECKSIRINPNPDVLVLDGVYCIKQNTVSLNNLVLKPFSKVGGIESFRCLAVPTGSGANASTVISSVPTVPVTFNLDISAPFNSNSNGIYLIEYTFKDASTGCQRSDTATVLVKLGSKLKFNALNKLCLNQGIVALDSFVRDSNNRVVFGGNWETIEYGGSRNRSIPSVAEKLDSSIVAGKYFRPWTGSGQYLLRYTNAGLCDFTDSVIANVNGLPVIQIDAEDTVCYNRGLTPLLNIKPSGMLGTWSGNGLVNGRFFDPQTSPHTNTFHGPYKMFYTYTNPLTTCTSSDSLNILVQTTPEYTAFANPVSGTQYLVDLGMNFIKHVDSNALLCMWKFGRTDSTFYDSSFIKNIGRKQFIDSGDYTVVLYSGIGRCGRIDTFRFKLDYRTSSIQSSQISKIKLYPNPVKEQLQIEVPELAKLSLFDLNGRQLIEEEVFPYSKNLVNTQSLHNGMYLIRIEMGTDTVWKRIVIER
jgi:hypothetical protein